MDERTQLHRQGYLIVDSGLNLGEILRAEAEIQSLSIGGAGSRSLLSYAWCRRLGTLARRQSTVSSLLSKDAVAVQCILFAKSSVGRPDQISLSSQLDHFPGRHEAEPHARPVDERANWR